MKYFIKLSIEGSFPSGVDDLGTYQITEQVYNSIRCKIEREIYNGNVKKI